MNKEYATDQAMALLNAAFAQWKAEKRPCIHAHKGGRFDRWMASISACEIDKLKQLAAQLDLSQTDTLLLIGPLVRVCGKGTYALEKYMPRKAQRRGFLIHVTAKEQGRLDSIRTALDIKNNTELLRKIIFAGFHTIAFLDGLMDTSRIITPEDKAAQLRGWFKILPGMPGKTRLQKVAALKKQLNNPMPFTKPTPVPATHNQPAEACLVK